MFWYGVTSGNPHTHTHWKIFLWQPLRASLSLHPPSLSPHTPLSARVVQECMGRSETAERCAERKEWVELVTSCERALHLNTPPQRFTLSMLLGNTSMCNRALLRLFKCSVHTFYLMRCVNKKKKFLLRIKSQSHRRACVKCILVS